MVELIDVGPSLWKLAGLPIAKGIDGSSFDKLLTSQSEGFSVARSRFHRGKIHGFSIRIRDYRYTRWIDSKTGKINGEELYDYKNDPLETKNFINNPEYKEVTVKLRHLWEKELGKK